MIHFNLFDIVWSRWNNIKLCFTALSRIPTVPYALFKLKPDTPATHINEVEDKMNAGAEVQEKTKSDTPVTPTFKDLHNEHWSGIRCNFNRIPGTLYTIMQEKVYVSLDKEDVYVALVYNSYYDYYADNYYSPMDLYGMAVTRTNRSATAVQRALEQNVCREVHTQLRGISA